jgi:hypothetical protein
LRCITQFVSGCFPAIGVDAYRDGPDDNFRNCVGVTALLCYVVTRQSQNRRVSRTSSGDSSWSADTGYDAGDSGHHHHGASADHSGSDHSGPSGGGDSSGGGDAGGGDGGGGGSD